MLHATFAGPASEGVGDEGDRRDEAAVIGLAPMGGAAIAEEAVRIGIGAQARIRDLADAGPLEPGDDVGGRSNRLCVARSGLAAK